MTTEVAITPAGMKRRLDRATFGTSRLLDFCSRKELTAQTGHQEAAWPLVLVKELIDNALDACEEADIAPVLQIRVTESSIAIRDNGNGIPVDTVKSVLDYSIRVSSREAYVSPTRGAQGNALKTIIAMPFVLDGERGDIEIVARGTRHRITFWVDRLRQEPAIAHVVEAAKETNGTEIIVRWPDLACSLLADARSQFLQIASAFAWLNPHLDLTIEWQGDRHHYAPTAPSWSKWKPSDPTSPHWYKQDHIERLIAAYIIHDRELGRERTVREVVAEFRGLSGSAKQKKVLDETGLARAHLTELVNANGFETDIICRLLTAMQAHSKPVKPASLGLIGREHFRRRFEAAGADMESFDYKKVIDIDDGVPWVVETAFGWCPKETTRRLITGVNWSPGIINPFRELGTYGRSLDTILGRQRADRDEPIIMVLHMACPRVEYTDRGKSAVVVKS